MNDIITTVLPYISPTALPLIIVIVAGMFFYYKLKAISKDRENTKIQRDNDSLSIHADILKLKFKVSDLERGRCSCF